jgi:hypothetical protein
MIKTQFRISVEKNRGSRQTLSIVTWISGGSFMFFVPKYLLNPWNRVLLEKLVARSNDQGVPCELWNHKVDRCVYRSHSQIILCHVNPIHTLKTSFSEIRFNIILPFTPKCPEWPLSFRLLSSQNFYLSSPHARCMLLSSHPNKIFWGMRIVGLLIMQFS